MRWSVKMVRVKRRLMNILYGLHQPDSGQIFVNGQPSQRFIILMMPFNWALVWCISILSWFPLSPLLKILCWVSNQTGMGCFRKRDEAEMVRKLANDFGLPVDPYARIRDLPVGMQQRVEILKALQREAKILILDEPTAVLTPQEVKELLTVVRNLAERGRHASSLLPINWWK